MSNPSHARRTFGEIKTALRAFFGEDGRVIVADQGLPRIDPPYILITAPKVQTSHAAGTAMTEYHVVGTLEWWAYAAATENTTEARADAALDLGSEVVETLQDAHADAGNATLYDLTMLLAGWDDVFAEEPGLPAGVGMVHGTVQYETDLRRGG